MNISFLLTGKPPTFLLYFLSFENSVCVCALYILERRFIKHYLFLQPRRVVVKEASAVPSTSATVTTAGASASAAVPSASTSAAAVPSTSAVSSTSAGASARPSSEPPVDLYARMRLHRAGEKRIAAALRRFKELSDKPSVSMRKKTNLCMLGS